MKGVIYGILASMFVALSATYIKLTLKLVDNSILWLTYFKNLNALVLFLPIMLINGELVKLPDFEYITSAYFWSIMSIAGFFGCIMSQVTAWQVQVKKFSLLLNPNSLFQPGSNFGEGIY
jgi:solute carrier family 35 (GDP-fucose transporter), member C1